jgi:uncharacterized protein YecE (DUF72 family)
MSKRAAAEVLIGTSGWHYKHWIGSFYPPKTPASKMLAFYVGQFDTVELNNSFYRLPTKTALESWRDSTPKNFVFAAKGSRFLTHMKKLKDPETGLARFFGCIDILGKKLGPILFQLPPNWPVDLERLERFLEVLPPAHRYAFEFRNSSWDREEVYRALRRHNAAYCMFHLAGFQSPFEVTADFAYIRLHGPGGKYQGSYTKQQLENWSRSIRDWQHTLNQIFVYFDNDDSGFAAHNALTLKQLVGGKR